MGWKDVWKCSGDQRAPPSGKADRRDKQNGTTYVPGKTGTTKKGKRASLFAGTCLLHSRYEALIDALKHNVVRRLPDAFNSAIKVGGRANGWRGGHHTARISHQAVHSQTEVLGKGQATKVMGVMISTPGAVAGGRSMVCGRGGHKAEMDGGGTARICKWTCCACTEEVNVDILEQ